ncbi:hypothetical protein EON63_13000 [archaeon]|nr:MAG: hypothetical protein EON63_13000 [archaeon]
MYLNGWVAIFQFLLALPLCLPSAYIQHLPISQIIPNIYAGMVLVIVMCVQYVNICISMLSICVCMCMDTCMICMYMYIHTEGSDDTCTFNELRWSIPSHTHTHLLTGTMHVHIHIKCVYDKMCVRCVYMVAVCVCVWGGHMSTLFSYT